MKNFCKRYLAALLFFCGIATVQSQSPCESRYKSRIFNSIQVYRDVVYSKNAPKLLSASLGTETTFNADLKMDIFMPPPTDTAVKRPVVIIAHGGGFINVLFMSGTLLVGTKDNEDVQALCDTLAHWGFVTASIEYRTGFDVASTTSLKRAVWRGAQDMSAAVRFFRKNASWFNLDPERLFVGGSSAGAFCAIHSTFIDKNERIPESLQQFPIVMLDLGELHSRPVVELTGFNPFAGNNVLGNDVDSIAQGVAGFWGAIADTAMFAGNNKAPMIMYHGGNDPIVSTDCAQPFSSIILAAPVTCGTEIMDIALSNRNMTHSTTIAPGEGHEYWGALNGMWMTSGPNAYWMPIIEGTTNYFYEIMRPQVPILNGPPACAPNTVYTFSVASPVASSSYCWEIDGGTIVSPLTNGSSIDVLFYATTTLGAVKCSEIDQALVASQQRVRLVNVSTLVANELLEENKPSFDFEIFPNPANICFDVQFDHLPNETGLLEIFDIFGRRVLVEELSAATTRIQTLSLPAGQYVARLTSNKEQLAKRFTIKS